MTFRLGSILSGAASVCMIGASIALVLSVRPRGGATSASSESKPPSGPVPIEGVVFRGASQVRLVVYSDYHCPACRKFARDTVPGIMSRYVETGKVGIGFAAFPLEKIHPAAMRAAVIADCAAKQGLFWEAHDYLLLAEPTALLESARMPLWGTGRGPSDSVTLRACLDDSAVAQAVRVKAAKAAEFGIGVTPTIVVGIQAPDGGLRASAMLRGFRTVDEVAAVLDKALGSLAGSR